MRDKIRLDIAVQARTPSLSRAFAEKLIKQGKVTVDKEVVTKTSYKVEPEQKIIVDYQEQEIPKIDIPIIYEDNDCVVVDKPIGLLTHSKGSFNPEPTVASWLGDRTKNFNDERNGIVHRLDRATSGVMICAKNPKALEWLQKQFSSRKVIKTYYAVIAGGIEPKMATIDLPIERNPKTPQKFRVNIKGKPAQTVYKTIKTFQYQGKLFSLIELLPKTGRTHQLRVHLNYLKKPIVGDKFYDGLMADRLYLHAHKLEILLLNKQKLVFDSAMPKNFLKPRLIK